MQKSDLKTGMIVETRNNKEYVVFRNVCKTRYVSEEYNECSDDLLVNGKETLWEDLSKYNDDMSSKLNKSFDIIRVYIPNHPYSFTEILYENSKRELIWDRENQIKEITMDDLEKHFGCKIKIVK